MDREISKSEQNRGVLRKVLIPVVILALLGAGYWAMKSGLRKSARSSDLVVSTVDRGTVKSTLTATGLVIPAAELVINSPITTEIKELDLISGSEVKEGDKIMSLNQEFVKLEYDQLKDQLALRQNSMSRLKLEYDKDLNDLDYTNQIKALQINRLRAEVKNQERLLEVGGSTQEELESAQMQLKIAELEKLQLENQLAFSRAVNSTDKENLQLEYDIQYKKLRELSKKLNQTDVKSPTSGVITWINDNIGATVSDGEVLVRIANLTRYEIEATTTERNTESLYIGMPAEVRVGRTKLTATVSRINPEVINNTIRFYLSIDQEDHDKLRPNLRAEIQLIKSEKEDVLRSKRGSVLTGANEQFVYKVTGSRAEKVRIKRGLVSTEYFEIIEGLQVGDKIIISDLERFDHMDYFEIKD